LPLEDVSLGDLLSRYMEETPSTYLPDQASAAKDESMQGKIEHQ
jgi:hypothetical protein